MSNSTVESVWPKILNVISYFSMISSISYCNGLLDGNLFLPKM